jgi:paraquat-inducible protein B
MSEQLPTAHIDRRRHHFQIVWILPLISALMVAGYAIREFKNRGPEITIEFPEAENLSPGKTRIHYLGVTVGKITGLTVDTASATVRVTGRLNRNAADLAREGTAFIVVKPQVSFQGVEGLTTIFSGATVEMRPGQGPPAKNFKGFADTRAWEMAQPGLLLTLTSPRNGSLSAGVGVFYRGVRVGSVTDVGLSENGQKIVAQAKIDYKYDQFVRNNSKFWEASGIDAKMGLFGMKVKVDSLQTLWSGGVAFATPDPPGRPVVSGSTFALEPVIDPAWETWSPRL